MSGLPYAKVHVERLWQQDGFRIWFYRERPGGATVYRLKAADTWEEVEIAEGEAWPDKCSLYLPSLALESLIRATEGHVHVEDATVRHLDDAIGVRDRLLAIVERFGK